MLSVTLFYFHEGKPSDSGGERGRIGGDRRKRQSDELIERKKKGSGVVIGRKERAERGWRMIGKHRETTNTKRWSREERRERVSGRAEEAEDERERKREREEGREREDGVMDDGCEEDKRSEEESNRGRKRGNDMTK